MASVSRPDPNSAPQLHHGKMLWPLAFDDAIHDQYKTLAMNLSQFAWSPKEAHTDYRGSTYQD
jgi:hypothetical protein